MKEKIKRIDEITTPGDFMVSLQQHRSGTETTILVIYRSFAILSIMLSFFILYIHFIVIELLSSTVYICTTVYT